MPTTIEKKKPTNKNKISPGKRLQNGLVLKKHYGFARTIAIHLEQNSLQFATARRAFHKTKLLNVSKVYIPSASDSDEERQSFISAEIDKYIHEYGSRFTRYVLGVGGSESALRILSLPSMPPKELKNAIYWEGNKRIPFSLDGAYYGYHINENIIGEGKDRISVTLLAASRMEVNTHLSLMESRGSKVDAIYHELEAIGFLLPYIDGFDHNRTYSLINVKRDRSEISFYRGTKLEFMHISSVGSDHLADVNDNTSKFEYFTETLVNEIANSIDYYIGQFANTSTDQVFVYGDLTYSEELINRLTDRFGIEFKSFPVEKMIGKQPHLRQFTEEIPACLSTVALAMADREMINFLPPESIEKHNELKFYIKAAPLVALFVFTLGLYWSNISKGNELLESKINMADQEIQNFKQSPTFLTYNKIKNQIAADRAILNRIDQDPTILNLNLKELSRITPDQVRLELYDLQLNGARNSLTMAGQAISNNPPPEVILAEFYTRLDNSPFFNNVEIKKHNKRNQEGRFVIDFQLSMDAAI